MAPLTTPTPDIIPWSPYLDDVPVTSAGRRSLISAFSDVVLVNHGFERQELPEIFSAPEDEGEHDACRHMVVLDAALLTMQFVNARIATFARPLSGGEVMEIPAIWWEIDDPLPRMSTGVFNLEQWAHPTAPASHRIFVDCVTFDAWLAGLRPAGPLTNREIDAALDPQARASRAVADRRLKSSMPSLGEPASELRPAMPLSQQLAMGDDLLTREEVEAIVRFGRQSIYNKIRDDGFPEPLKLGALSRWKRSEILAWLEERAARRSTVRS